MTEEEAKGGLKIDLKWNCLWCGGEVWEGTKWTHPSMCPYFQEYIKQMKRNKK